ncbi:MULTISPECIES: hypothetical protein [Pseudomonas]|uniref:Uncharacterized protein n=1 Tax=Pseudomonas kuykendallii TaxID=1007099 RepID=A0A2W5CVZ6_9PSED|nr:MULTISPECIES: hypothetical protein [Pseudomonas]MCQ4272173.1 hypothetical protein [Pseudomonas kuykendallii]PZP22208.1 MAG: hypothetical protein DI599_16625 [Pseudomonas kuykendallii]SDW42342.1 hypothetical protein SAMN05216287_0960 [Pseudomonas kuykendallii]
MHGSEPEDGLHSTLEDDPRPRMWPRFLLALALFGLLLGMMIGRLNAPQPALLQRVEVLPGALVLWFDREPKVFVERIEGTLAMLIETRGKEAGGQLLLDGRPVNWRIVRVERGLLLNLVAALPLHGALKGAAEEGGWRLEISLRAE